MMKRRRGDQKVLDEHSGRLLEALNSSLEFCVRKSHDKVRERIVADFASLDKTMGQTGTVVGQAERKFSSPCETRATPKGLD